ncbi:hypothetical protein H4582DRAFT_2077580 [Lactarius indigo]|nr:hypothetical protein H4582DRAFT_2077580 [Lactarius indigo]
MSSTNLFTVFFAIFVSSFVSSLSAVQLRVIALQATFICRIVLVSHSVSGIVRIVNLAGTVVQPCASVHRPPHFTYYCFHAFHWPRVLVVDCFSIFDFSITFLHFYIFPSKL